MSGTKRVIIIIVEGQSEIAYLSELNRFFREEEIDCVFYPVKAVNGIYREVRKTYRETRRRNRNARIEILVDRDIYIRDIVEIQDYSGREKDGLPRFRFAYMNHEDYLIMHQSPGKARRWNKLMKDAGHDVVPLTAKKYMAIIHSSHIWSGMHYKKGEVPFEITQKRLENLFRNDSDSEIFMHSDLTDLLVEILPSDKLL